MADAQIRAVITAKDEASGVVAKFGASSAAAFGAVAGIVQSLTTKGIDVLTQSIGSAVKRVDTLNNSTRVFSNMGYAADATKAAMDGLTKSILGLPTPLDSAVRGMQMIASTTNDIGRAQSIFSAMNDAIIGFGGSADMVENATIQLSQAFSNGRIDAQTWNSMMQSGLGPTLNAIAKQMNITTGALKEGLSDGSISVKKFQDKLIELDKKGGGGLKSLHQIALDATAGIGTGLENAKTAITRGMANIIKAIGPEKISNAISKVGSSVEQGLTGFAGIMGKLSERLGELAVRAIPVFINVLRDLQTIGSIVWDKMRQAIDFLWPSVQTLWTHLQTMTQKVGILFKDLQPLLTIIGETVGAGIVGAIWLMINATDTIVKSISKFSDWAHNNHDILVAIGTAFAAIGANMAFTAAQSLAIGSKEAVKALYAFASASWAAVAPWIELAGYVYLLEKAYKILDQWSRLKEGNFGLLDQLKAFPQWLKQNNIGKFTRASGGTVNMNTPYLVGEKGPEMFVPGRTGTIIPNDKMTATTSTQATVNISLNGVFTGTPQEARKLANMVLDNLKDVANAKNMTLAELMR